jgi:hypothetical protein
MIKMLAVLPRKKDISAQEFHDHWRHPHGSMGKHIAVIRSYVQCHQIHTDLLGADQTRYEGVAEVWSDNCEEALGLMDDPMYLAHVQQDELAFIDMERLKFTFMDEEILLARRHVRTGASFGDSYWTHADRPNTIKLIQFIEADGAKAWAQGQDKELGDRIGAFRHVRQRPNARIHGGMDPRVGSAPFIGIRELSWPTLTAFNQGVAQAPEVLQELLARPAKSVASLYHAERFV